MGQSNSAKRLPKQVRAERDETKHKIADHQIKKIENAQTAFWANAKKTDLVDYNEFNRIMNTAETAKAQLSKGGAPLTKSDLIAICIRMEPAYANKVDQLQQYTVSDLNALIRCIAYDVPELNASAKNNATNAISAHNNATNAIPANKHAALMWK
jgi:hypothetical protein